MLLLALLFGLLSQYLFVGAEPGVSVLVFVLGFYGLFFYSVKGRIGGFEKWRGQLSSGWLLFVPVALLSLSYAVYDNDFFRALNGPAIFALVVAQTVLLTRSSAKPWYRGVFYADLLYLSLIKPITALGVPFSLLADRLKGNRGEETGALKGNAGKITLGLVLAAPILVVVVSLLASADEIFFSWIVELLEAFGRFSVGDGFFRLFVAAFFMLYAFCYIWGLLFRKPSENGLAAPAGDAAEPSAGTASTTIDPVTAGTLLVSINAVYVLFVVIQFSYLFGAASGLLPEGSAYAEYARRGFAELIMVALINIGLLMGGLHLIRRTGGAAELVRKLSLTVLIGCTMVMLASAYSRLSLYEEAYGFTHSRLLVHGFMIYLGVLLAVAMLRIWKERFSMAKVYIGVSIAAYVLMNYANLDARIASTNIERYERTGKIDLAYLGTLSADAAPALRKLQAKHPELAGLDEIVRNMRNEARAGGKWQSWNLSKERAD
ncbi:DUF4153 domain-containing protein [Paenibacillus arenilitoris]|nr:DUF4173 domain-containing protein [Paenibacillus arenilitoris]